ncbi:MAG: TetR/AcrR family transcriptional regulator [Pedobacter sp.]|nr:MAG: TetR/AcrR family transcriptional regulator [Pedobacter sp.]
MDNRTKILKSSLELFALRGYEAVGVQEIALASEITKPTIYHYFGNKIGLLDTLLKEYNADFFDKLNKEADYQGDLPLTLFRLTKAYFNFAKKEKIFYKMQLSFLFAPEASDTMKAIKPIYNKQFQIIEEVFVKAGFNHGNMRGKHRIYASTFIGMINTYINLFLMDELELDDETIYKAVHQFSHGIYS